MKRTKKLLLAATLLVVLGLVAFIVGMSVLDWNFNRLDATEYTAKSFAAENDAIKRVNLDVNSFPIEIKTGNAVSLDYYEATNSDVSVSTDGDTLKVVEKYKFMPFKTGLFTVSRNSHKFVLTVPNDIELTISGVNSMLNADGISFAELKLNVTNLTMDFSDCSFGDVSVNTTNFDLSYVRCSARSLNVDCTNADISIGDCTISELTVDGTNTDVVIERSLISKLYLDGTNGDYELKSLTVDDLSLSAVNLDADVEISGNKSDYTITVDGDDLPHEQTGTTDKKIYLEGVNCDVDLKFV